MKDSCQKKRRKNLRLRRSVKGHVCICCRYPWTDPCHVVTYNVSGGDEWFNVIPMCRQHHTEQHQVGWRIFMVRYPMVQALLKELGWEWETVFGKFVMTHPELRRH